MLLEVKKCLFDILNAAKSIEQFTCRLEYTDYLADGQVQAAVERKFEIIGEALNRIKKLDASVLESISEHRRIIGFRNVISHGYDTLDAELVWDAVRTHLPALKEQVEQLQEDV
ncbi:MAG: HepT-like ribonuclease domain-containing protein [Planctomycetota bacterium]